MKTLVKILLIAGLVGCLSFDSIAQDSVKLPAKPFSFAITTGHYGLDPSLGIEVGTPTFSKERFCVRFKANLNWLEPQKAALDKWVSYHSFAISWVYNTQLYERTRLYVDLETFLVVPDSKFASNKNVQGLSGVAGLEFFISNHPKLNLSYYFGGGLSYARAYADKMEGKPRYANGLAFDTGIRFYFQ